MLSSTIDCGCSFTNLHTDPCLIVIFGASGDLTARKLIPALYRLFSQGSLPENFVIVGCSRTRMNDAEFCAHLEKHLSSQEFGTKKSWQEFAAHLRYVQLLYDSPKSFADLATSLKAFDEEFRTGWNRIFYLATPPSLYGAIATGL
nr:glucose-6-phosphate dehydrogenase [Desulfobulbaceae bacterium]